MTLFGIIWFICIIYCFSRKNIKYMFAATLFFMTFQCSNVININAEKGIGPQVLTSAAFVLKALTTNHFRIKKYQQDKSKALSICLIAFLAAITASIIYNGILTEKLLVLLQIMIYAACFFLMKLTIPQKITREELYRYIRYIILFITIMTIIQWCTTMFFPIGRVVLKPLFYNDNSTNIYFNYNDRFHNRRVYSTFMEPSYMAAFEVASFFFLLCFKNKWRRNIFLFPVLAVIIIMSYSSTAYGAFAITGIIFVTTTKEMKWKWKLLIVFMGIIFALVFYFQFYSILDEVIFSKSLTGSAVTRARWNFEALKAFHSSPIFGVGYKATRGSSIVYSLLGETGILGIVFFLAFNVLSFWRIIFRTLQFSNFTPGFYGVLYAVLASFLCLVIACPDTDLCSYWFWLYLLSCYNGHELCKKRKALPKTRKRRRQAVNRSAIRRLEENEPQ